MEAHEGFEPPSTQQTHNLGVVMGVNATSQSALS